MSHRTHRVAAIDIGTITARLLVADVGSSGIAQVLRATDFTHLGEGSFESRELSRPAMERTARIVREYALKLRRLGAESYRAVATASVRGASNAADLRALVAESGIEIETITGQEEAYLSFTGAVHGMSERDVLVCDVGGGSSEIAFGDASEGSGTLRFAHSLDVGARSLTDTFLHGDPPTADEVGAARAWTREKARPLFAALPDAPRVMVALAGTATTISAVNQGLVRYEPALIHGSVVTSTALLDLSERLAMMTHAERLQVVGLQPERAGVIVGGALVLGVLLEEAGLGSTIVSEHDILYGIAIDLHHRRRGGEKIGHDKAVYPNWHRRGP